MMSRLGKRARKKQPLGSVCVLLVSVLNWQAGFAQTNWQASGDWPQFRGPTRDLISPETGLLKEWPTAGPQLLWKIDGLGRGYSSVSISAGMIFTQGHIDGVEKLIALNQKDGTPLWAVDLGPALEVGQPGSRSTPTLDGEYVYVETVAGDLVCLTQSKGKEVWRKHLLKDFDGKHGSWGYAESPLVDQGRVIYTPGGKQATLVALDKHTGQTIWRASVPQGDVASYSSPIVAEPARVRQYIQYLSGGVVGIRASDGEILWRENSSAQDGGINCSSPVYHEGYVFTAASYGKGGALVRLVSEANGFTPNLEYTTKKMKSHHGGFVLWQGHLYGTDEQMLTCMNFRTGKVLWQDRSVGKGAVAYADGRIYLRSERGAVALIEATPEGYRQKGRFEQPDRSDMPAWAYPVIADGKLYLRDHDILLCYDIRAKATQ